MSYASDSWLLSALDPARPLIAPGIGNRLDSGDAKSVQVMHTNAGYYGEGGRVGHVDFCVNGGKRQPYCSSTSSKCFGCTPHTPFDNPIFVYIIQSISDANLCSHIWSVCYLSQSIYDSSLMNAEPCTRRCPVGIRNFRNNRFLYRQSVGFDIPMGQHTPMKWVNCRARLEPAPLIKTSHVHQMFIKILLHHLQRLWVVLFER